MGAIFQSVYYVAFLALLGLVTNGELLIERQTVQSNRLVASGIAVWDLEKSLSFYTSVIGMKPLIAFNTTSYDEVVLNYPDSAGASLVLMKWHDGRGPSKTSPVPVKIVHFVTDPVAFAHKIEASGNEVTSMPSRLSTGFARDPDGYTIEINNISLLKRDDPTIKAENVVGATGIGVEVLHDGLNYYEDVVGMERQSTLRLIGWSEHIMNFPGDTKSALVLVNWNDGETRNYKDVPVKLVFGLEDPVAWAAGFKARGGNVIIPPTPQPGVGNATVGFAKDLSGYLLEMAAINIGELQT